MEPWGAIISALLAIIACLLGIISRQNWKLAERIEKKVDAWSEKFSCELKDKVDKKDCTDDQSKCAKGPSWDAFRAHGHEGLPAGSRVIG